MFVVAIVEISGTVDTALPSLAVDLGTTAYELKLTVNAGLPAVVLLTADGARAAAAGQAIERRGHRAIVCDRRALVPSSGMTELRDFELRGSGIAPSTASPELLPYADLRVLVRATHRSTSETTKEVKEKKLALGMAVVTGGLILSRKTTREVTTHAEERQQVLYLFRRSEAPPWILRERGAHYQGLEADLSRTSLENFATTLRRLRESAPHATVDERLVVPRAVRGVAEGVPAADLLAHLVAAGCRVD